MSDHNSSPRAVAEPAIDLTDLYVFPSPSRPGRLVLVMGVFPNALTGALFSDAASYRFRLRPIQLPAARSGAGFEVGTDEYDITCTFAAPVTTNGAGGFVQEGSCTLPDGAAVSFRVNDEEGAEAPGARVFAGLRMDPLFIDSTGYVETFATRRLSFQETGSNAADGWNILGIVVELDVATMLGGAPGTLFAVAAETVTAGKMPMRLERFGRLGVKNQLLAQLGADTVNRDLDLRELYSQEDPFELASDYLGAYRARLNANLAALDRIDGKLDWPLRPDGTHPLTELFLADYQVVDVAKPFSEHSYLEIEQALLQGRAHATCGGRSLNDDALDANLTFIVTGGNGPPISDGVDQATVRASDSFPYVAPPNPDPAVAGRVVVPSKVADQLAAIQAAGLASR
ncbi:MAG: hypothetical protein QOD24_2515 [Solirubrobacteraceae bacterium]|jgi:hypothetical protein|nr:hypothetical protein [Solirubrobacteraceae bacterium]